MANLSALYVALAALCWGLSGGIGGVLMADGWDAYVVSFYRGAIGLIFVFVWLLFRPQGNGLTNYRLWLWSIIAGIGVAGNFVFYFMSISEGSVAVAVTLMYCAPVFVFLVSFVLKLERITPVKSSSIAMVMLGIILLTGIYDMKASVVTQKAVVTGLFSGLSYAVFIFGFKYATPHGSPQAILLIAFATLISILIWPGDVEQLIAVLDTPSWPLFIVLGVLGAGFSFILYIIGLKHTAPTIASILAMVEPVTATLFGFVVLNEILAGPQFIGIGLILLTVTVFNAKSKT